MIFARISRFVYDRIRGTCANGDRMLIKEQLLLTQRETLEGYSFKTRRYGQTDGRMAERQAVCVIVCYKTWT